MLFKLMLDVFFAPLEALSDALPEWSLTWGFGEYSISVPTWFPVTAMLSTVVVTAAWNVGLILFTIANFIYRHIPQVLGTGPGSG